MLVGWMLSDRLKAFVLWLYVRIKITYDTEEQKDIKSGEITNITPVPDEVLTTGKGTCLDFAALYAAMLSAVGIDAKIVMGYASFSDAYHAWNEIFIGGEWKIVDIARDGKNLFVKMYKNASEYKAG